MTDQSTDGEKKVSLFEKVKNTDCTIIVKNCAEAREFLMAALMEFEREDPEWEMCIESNGEIKLPWIARYGYWQPYPNAYSNSYRCSCCGNPIKLIGEKNFIEELCFCPKCNARMDPGTKQKKYGL